MRFLAVLFWCLVSSISAARSQEILEFADRGDDWRAVAGAVMMVNDQPTDDSDPLRAPLIACWDTACAKQSHVQFDRAEAAALTALFPLGLDGAAERQAIARAVGLMEVFVGACNGTLADHPGNRRLSEDEPGQLDCISESVNTHTFLVRLAEAGLLSRHRVGGLVVRYSLILQHVAASLRDIEAEIDYAVDFWVGAGGEEPEILPWADWRLEWAA